MIQFKMAFLPNDVKEILAYTQENQPDASFLDGEQNDADFTSFPVDANRWLEQINPGRIFRGMTADSWITPAINNQAA